MAAAGGAVKAREATCVFQLARELRGEPLRPELLLAPGHRVYDVGPQRSLQRGHGVRGDLAPNATTPWQ